MRILAETVFEKKVLLVEGPMDYDYFTNEWDIRFVGPIAVGHGKVSFEKLIVHIEREIP